MTRRPKVLFLGANTAQIPYLRAARRLGFEVIATDHNAKAPGADHADGFHRIGYDDTDALLRAARADGFGPGDRIFTASAHHAYDAASRVAEALDIPFAAPGAVDTCLDKSRFYALLSELGVPLPPTRTYFPGQAEPIPSDRVFYLKSDYGKSPNYCYRVVDGVVPALPERFDAFYRKVFLLQQEVQGVHYRLDLYGDEVASFQRIGRETWLPVELIGPGHGEVVTALREVVDALELREHVTKFDIVASETGWVVLDIGLDRPLRMLLLCRSLGIDFELAYTRSLLLDGPRALPRWSELCRPLLISGDAVAGYRVAPIGAPR